MKRVYLIVLLLTVLAPPVVSRQRRRVQKTRARGAAQQVKSKGKVLQSRKQSVEDNSKYVGKYIAVYDSSKREGYIEFKSDGTFVITDKGYTLSGNYEIKFSHIIATSKAGAGTRMFNFLILNPDRLQLVEIFDVNTTYTGIKTYYTRANSEGVTHR